MGEPGERLLYGDLQYENVLASEREPWLAIDPKPLAGEPGSCSFSPSTTVSTPTTCSSSTRRPRPRPRAGR
ncbi:aminoglycoside phosphotransferase family protein [Nocardia sp. NPDC049707]|uniref:aminoglycoside phosphotransferase family protein n=1 Tax=Nocardia sp. NPDC049707 TaxID=3154735 RepID=UPI0034184D46